MFIYKNLFYSLFMGLRETFRQNLIYYRKQAGLTQEQLSEKCDFNLKKHLKKIINIFRIMIFFYLEHFFYLLLLL